MMYPAQALGACQNCIKTRLGMREEYPSNIEDVKWSEWVESVCKDVECTSGILKADGAGCVARSYIKIELLLDTL